MPLSQPGAAVAMAVAVAVARAAVHAAPWQVPPLQLCGCQMLCPGVEPGWQMYWTESPWDWQAVPPIGTPLSQPPATVGVAVAVAVRVGVRVAVAAAVEVRVAVRVGVAVVDVQEAP